MRHLALLRYYNYRDSNQCEHPGVLLLQASIHDACQQITECYYLRWEAISVLGILGTWCYRCLYVHRLVFLSFRAPPYAILAYGGTKLPTEAAALVRLQLLRAPLSAMLRLAPCPCRTESHELARDLTKTTDLVLLVRSYYIPPFVVSPCGG